MKRAIIQIIFVFLCGICSAENYYIDQTGGIDGNDGLSEQSAWQGLKNVNNIEFHPGDSILFKRGGQWSGILNPRGSGSKNSRIVLSSYGEGPAPVFDAAGEKKPSDLMSATILLFNQEYWEIRDIEVRNFETGNPERPVEKSGILVLAKDVGTLHDFRFINLKISRINGSLKTRYNGGIFLNVIADSIPENRVPTNFDGIYVNNCHFLEVDRGGFLNQSFWRRRDMNSAFGDKFAGTKTNNWFPSYNILIENSIFERVGGNGLVTRVAESPVVQYNLFVKCSFKTTGNASYPYNCNNALWQFNEACYTIYNEGDVDASGFDSDYLCKNTVIQYNYSHHNEWGGLLVCCWGKVKGSFNDGTIVRYNVFQDEAHHMIRFSGNITHTEISNNLFITDTKIDDVLLWYKEWGEIWPDKTVLSGNVFYNQGTSSFMKLGETTHNSIKGNALSGSSFTDFNNFDLILDRRKQKALKSSVKMIRKVGERRDFRNSRAWQVVQYMWEMN